MRDDDNICRQSLMNKFALKIKGLGSEGERVVGEAGFMDQRFQQDKMNTITKALSKVCRKERKRKLENSRKGGGTGARRTASLMST